MGFSNLLFKKDSYGDIKPNWPLLSTTAIVSVVGGLTLLSGIHTIDQGMAGVITTGGAVQGIAQPGFGLHVPIIQGIKTYNTDKVFEVKLENMEIYYSPDDISQKTTPKNASQSDNEFSTKDIAKQNAQQYTVHNAVVRASMNAKHIEKMHTKYGSMDVIKRFVDDRATEAYKSVVRGIDPLKINSSRDIIGPKTASLLQAKIDEEVGLKDVVRIESVTFLDFSFEKGVKDAFELANKERASIQAEQYALEKESIKVKTARKRGEAASAEKIAKAEGEAQSITIRGEALRKNPNVASLEAIEAWKAGGSQVPQVWVTTQKGQDGAPMMFPLNITKPAPRG